jgi:hypothetical protein
VTASLDHTVRFWDLPPVGEAPPWLADLAEAAAQAKVSTAGNLEPVGEDKLLRLSQERLATTSTEPWATFGRWYFADATMRTVSPWSGYSLHDYVRGLASQGSEESYKYAETLCLKFPVWSAEIQTVRKAWIKSP